MYEEFHDPRLVALYDLLNPWGADDDFYLALPGPTDRSVLDVGCGTGRLATAFAGTGRDVVGVDPAPAMLDVAQARAGADSVTWLEATAAGFRSRRGFDLAVMTGHVFQVFPDDAVAVAALANIRRHLGDGGRLGFETRNPLPRPWTSWTRDRSMRSINHPAHGRVEVWTQIDDVSGDLVGFTMNYRFAAAPPATSRSTLRFPDRDTVVGIIEAAGLTVSSLFGDWDRSEFAADSPEIIVVAGT